MKNSTMVSTSLISLILLLITNLPNEIQTQSFKSGYFVKIQKDKNILTNSSNLIKSFVSDKTNCLLSCNQNILCYVAIYNSNNWCTLSKVAAINELIDLGEETAVFINQNSNPISNITNGLTNYWPIVNDLRDYIGSSDMIPGTLDPNESIGFTQDRLNNPNGAINMNPGYYILPPGIYFNNSFSFLVWAKAFKLVVWSRFIDCGNGPNSDNIAIILSLNNAYDQIPCVQMYRGSVAQPRVTAVNKLPLNTWFHFAVVYDGQNLMIYVNGNLEANSTSGAPLTVNRTKCYIGRSNWNDSVGNSDAYACYDDIMIYNRALSTNELKNCMNTSFY